MGMVISTPPLGRGGTSRFMSNVSQHPSVCADISYSFLPMAFKCSDMVTMDKTLNILSLCGLGSIFKVTGSHYVSKLLILLCNSKIIEASTFAWNALLAIFCSCLNGLFEISILFKINVRQPYLLLVKSILHYSKKNRSDFCLKYIIRLLFAVV